MRYLNRIRLIQRGDTIVEVLLAIGIASFTIGVTYTTAEHSLEQSINAKQRTEALNIMENQVTDIRLRFLKTSSDSLFTSTFGASHNHFCLDDTAAKPTDPNWTTLYSNGSNSPLSVGPYNAACAISKANENTTFYVDIETTSLGGSITQNSTVYHVFVRWQRTGAGPINQASVFYRPNGPSGQSLGYINGFVTDQVVAKAARNDQTA